MVISSKMWVIIIMVLSILFYFHHKSNNDKAHQQLLKRTMEKPVEQIKIELNPTFIKMINDDNNTKE